MRAMVRLLVVLLIISAASAAHAASFYDDCISRNVDRMLTGCAKVLSLGPRVARKNRAAAALNLGWAYEQGNGEHDLAISNYTLAIEFDPTFVKAYVNRGIVYGVKGDTDKALADYNTALSLDPKATDAYQERGQLWANKGNFDAALTDFSTEISLAPTYALGYQSRGNVYFQKNDLALALADYEKSLALEPDNPVVESERKTTLDAINAAAAPPPPVVDPSASAGRAEDVAKVAPLDGTRIALVIGNSAYAALPKLDNPRHDAEDLAEALGGLGFQVSLATDVDRDTMEDKLAAFAKASRHADVALIFFSGHGLQFNNVNYIAPVDAHVDDETDLRHLIPVQGVIEDLENAPHVRLLILDACRETGALQRLASSLPAKRGVSVKRGLTRIDAEGTFIAYSTQAGSVADDGSGGRNSPFTAALLKHLPEPGVDLRVLFTRVRGDVYRKTNGAQNPEVSDSLVGEFAFK